MYREPSQSMKTIFRTLPQSLIQLLMRSDNITMEHKTTISNIFPLVILFLLGGFFWWQFSLLWFRLLYAGLLWPCLWLVSWDLSILFQHFLTSTKFIKTSWINWINPPLVKEDEKYHIWNMIKNNTIKHNTYDWYL